MNVVIWWWGRCNVVFPFQCHDKNRDEARCKLEAPEVQAQRQTQAHPTYVSAGVTMVDVLVRLYDTLVPNQLLLLQFAKPSPACERTQ